VKEVAPELRLLLLLFQLLLWSDSLCCCQSLRHLCRACESITCDAMRESSGQTADIADCDLVEALLYKYTNVVKGFQYRWFILDPSRGTLEYFMVSEEALC
jgi:hypothetical protein